MSLQVWLPLCGNIQNYGLADVNVASSGAIVNTAGKIGSCYSFDGSDDYISLSGSSLYNIIKGGPQPFSIAMWVYHADATRAVLFGDYGLSGAINFNLELSTQHYLRFYWGGSPDTTPAATAISQSVWTHIAFIYDCQAVKFYVNGVLKYTLSGALSVKSKTSGSYYLGRDSRTGTTVLKGRINDFRIYDHCLSQAEIHEIAKGKMIHLKLDNGGFGQENLAIGSQGIWVSNLGSADGSRAEYRAKSLGQAFPVTSGTKVRLSFDLHMEVKTARTASEMKLIVYNTNNKGPHYGWIYQEVLAGRALTVGDVIDEHFSFIGTVNDKSDATLSADWIEFYSVYGTNNWYSISNLHIEPGEIETPWAPNSTDTVYTTYQLGTQFDCSGYQHDAITNAITPSSDTARYVCSSVFNGSSSYVKVNDTTWMADRMPAMTINLWAKNSAWHTNTHFFSCTEGGGFNTEAGNSGYLRFPISVYTAATGSSYAYKFDSNEIKLSDLPVGEWVMLTWIYDLTGTKTYINGNLHHTYTNTSYGIHFYTGARLFLGCEANAANPSSPWFGGQLSDFRLYATALSEEDIKILYHTSGFVDNSGNVFAGELREV